MAVGVRRAATRIRDAIRYSRLTGAAVFSRAALGATLALNATRRSRSLLQAYRLTFRRFLLRRLRDRLPLVRQMPDDAVVRVVESSWSRFAGRTALDRSVLLKPPAANGERGVMLIFPEYNWLLLASDPQAAKYVSGRYTLILTAGWSPLDYSLLELLTRRLSGTLFLQPCNRTEVDKIEAFHPALKCLPTLGCDWINPDLYRPQPRDRREVDLVMVANWGPFKRHWHLFDALRSLPAGLRVRLIGQPDGPFTLDRVRRQARDFGVPQSLEFADSLPVDEVQANLMSAKVSVVLSRHEGYCGAVTESMFADTPVGLLRDAYIGSKEYINPQTGVLLPARGLGRALADFLERAADFRPRAWAVEHISCHRSLPKVNEALRTSAESEGRPWTTDIAPFCWRPLATLIRPEDADRLRPAGEELMARFPDLFGQAMWSSLRTESTAPRSAPAAPAATAGEGDANRLLPGLVSGDG